jgi:DNA repair photolyase
MKIMEASCRTALSPSKLQGTDFALNPYKGCQHQCIYCYSRFVQGMSRDDWSSKVQVKRNIPVVLAKELKSKKGMVSIGTVTDPYQPAEERYSLTRYCIEQLVRRKSRFSILTKSSLVLRDMDIIGAAENAEVGVTLTTLDDGIRQVIEPHASPVKERLKVLETIAADHPAVKRYAFIGPIIPHVTTRDLEKIMHLGVELGLDYVIVDKLRLKPGMWDDIQGVLEDKLPEVGDVPELEQNGYFNAVRKKVVNLAASTGLKTYIDF